LLIVYKEGLEFLSWLNSLEVIYSQARAWEEGKVI